MRTVLAVCAAFLALAAPAAAQVTDTTPTVAADGLGTATLTPDVADFSVGVNRIAPTARGARSATNTRIASVMRVMRARGVAEADIRTTSLSVVRERVRRRGRTIRIRYHAEQSLGVRSRNIAELGALLDAVTDAGADEVSAPDFGFADPSAGRLLATRAALADARRRADDAAAQAGLRITGVRSVDLDPSRESVTEDQSDSSAGGEARSAPTRVSPGTQDFVERVRVVYTAAPV
jgi:uncharacterized protein